MAEKQVPASSNPLPQVLKSAAVSPPQPSVPASAPTVEATFSTSSGKFDANNLHLKAARKAQEDSEVQASPSKKAKMSMTIKERNTESSRASCGLHSVTLKLIARLKAIDEKNPRRLHFYLSLHLNLTGIDKRFAGPSILSNSVMSLRGECMTSLKCSKLWAVYRGLQSSSISGQGRMLL